MARKVKRDWRYEIARIYLLLGALVILGGSVYLLTLMTGDQWLVVWKYAIALAEAALMLGTVMSLLIALLIVASGPRQ